MLEGLTLFDKVLVAAAVIYSIALHEVGHAVVAYWCGDDTAKKDGRITLNPIPSIDLVGSILVPIILLVTKAPVFLGWPKPVTVVPDRLKPKVVGDILVSLAGVTVNLILAFLLLTVRAIVDEDDANPYGALERVAYLNIHLVVINLVPIPPLDGHHVVKHLLPQPLRRYYERIGFVGVLLLLLGMYFVPAVRDAFWTVFGWVYTAVEAGAHEVAMLFA